MNVWTGDDTAVITAEVPGVLADEIDISVVGETLTLSGERKPEKSMRARTLPPARTGMWPV